MPGPDNSPNPEWNDRATDPVETAIDFEGLVRFETLEIAARIQERARRRFAYAQQIQPHSIHEHISDVLRVFVFGGENRWSISRRAREKAMRDQVFGQRLLDDVQADFDKDVCDWQETGYLND